MTRLDGTYQRVTGPAPACDLTAMDAIQARLGERLHERLAGVEQE